MANDHLFIAQNRFATLSFNLNYTFDYESFKKALFCFSFYCNVDTGYIFIYHAYLSEIHTLIKFLLTIRTKQRKKRLMQSRLQQKINTD